VPRSTRRLGDPLVPFDRDDLRPRGPGRVRQRFGTERDPDRLVFVSDAVIAIAVTLLVLEIRRPQDTRHLLHGLAALWPSYGHVRRLWAC
jgi:Endosomal/lysosomal potassium channel TMEM175